MKWTILFIILLIVVAGFFFFDDQQQGTPDVDTSSWITYTNESFNFTLKHPSDWKVMEFPDDQISPKFNVVKESTAQEPLTHHNDTSQVSVFPEGIPTEGVLGMTKKSKVDFKEDTQNARDYLLENNEAWGTVSNFTNPPSSWNEAGFVWARAAIQNLETSCLRDAQEVGPEECDPLASDDEIIRRGEVDKEERAIEVAILESFEFIEGDSGTTTDPFGPQAKKDLIRLETPEPGDTISSPLVIRGEARGPWFFEATFPVVLTDWDGVIIAEHYAEAKGEWMTEDFVPFEATLEFDKPSYGERGSLILQKANPSGLPENQDALEISVFFEE